MYYITTERNSRDTRLNHSFMNCLDDNKRMHEFSTKKVQLFSQLNSTESQTVVKNTHQEFTELTDVLGERV